MRRVARARPPELSELQREILRPEIRVVEAGPGSGKTRAIVARFMYEAERGSGVAMLSFTNAAIDEVRRRTSSDRLLKSPYFVGTIDGFLHRFIVTPYLVAKLGKRPTYLPSWRELPPHHDPMVRLKTVPGFGIGLDRFVPAGDRIALDSSALSTNEQHYLDEVARAGERDRLVRYAGVRIGGYTRSGIYDASTARARAFLLLSEETGKDIVRRLSARFGLLLVDEAQDCDAAEMHALQLLAREICTIFVADPDQCIYEFRSSDPTLFTRLRDAQPEAARMELTVNHRSTSAICAAVTALRASGVGVIEPADSGKCAPVLLLAGTKSQQRTKFRSALAEYGIASSDAIVLAHAAKAAAAVAGHAIPKLSKAAGSRLAMACSLLVGSDAGPAERRLAIADVERVLLSLLTWEPDELWSASRARQLEALERNPAWLRGSAAEVITGLAGITDRDEFGRTSRELVARTLAGLPRACCPLGTSLKKPDPGTWSYRMAEPRPDSLAHDRIHGCKGCEFSAVLLSLNSLRKENGRDVLDEWADGANTEARRVLYVGASRAKHLLAFGGPDDVVDRVCQLLRQATVPIRRL